LRNKGGGSDFGPKPHPSIAEKAFVTKQKQTNLEACLRPPWTRAPPPHTLMDRLIPVVNRLQDVFQRCGVASPIDLPQVVVVGTQSSGKSSVLEAIIGRDFLPRGTGVVTRRPLLLQLIKLPENNIPAKSSSRSSSSTRDVSIHPVTSGPAPSANDFWVEFLHRPGEKFDDIAAIREEIQVETDRAAGTNKKLVPNALIIKVFATDVVDLTLIDLPGITKVPVGDQPPDIEKLVRMMITSYIENKNSIILAVHPANTDLATSDALQLARSVDPHGSRTLGVLTKLDLMDPGTNALDMLNGRVIPLRRGYIGVVNRSQAQLDCHLPMDESRVAEMAYFKSSPVYAPYADRMGSAFLATTLSGMLMEHIRDKLPGIRVKITSHLSQVQSQLKALGPVLAGAEHQAALLLNLLTRYAAEFSNALDGRASAATHELTGGARISFIFHDKFGRDLDGMDPFEELDIGDIRTALRNATGHRTPLFIPESAFELLVKRQIARFLSPSLSCVDLVYDELTRLAESVESPELGRFSRLRDSIAETTLKLLKQHKEPTTEMVRNLLEMELNYINTWHPNFVGGKRALTAVVYQQQQEQQQKISHDHQQQAISQQQKQSKSHQGLSNGLSSSGIGIPGALATSSLEHPDAWVEKNLLGQQDKSNGSRGSNGFLESIAGGVGGVAGGGGSGGGKLFSRLKHGFQQPHWPSDNQRGSKSRSDSFASSEKAGDIERLTVPTHIRVGSSDPVGDSEGQELAIMRMLIESYFDIVRKRLQDMVPKAIITFLVNKSKETLQATLVTKLYKPENVTVMMKEGSEASQKRKDLETITEMLSEALGVINEVRDVY
jgi:dynamin 1-like protein